MGQYGPMCLGIPGINGIAGNVFSVTYGWKRDDESSIPTSRPKLESTTYLIFFLPACNNVQRCQDFLKLSGGNCMALRLYRRHARSVNAATSRTPKADNLKRVAEVGNGAPA